MTAQIPEQIYIDDKVYGMFSEPLFDYLDKLGLTLKLNADDTACYRGYVGTWVIENDELYLIKFLGYYSPVSKILLNDLFPGKKKVFAEWYTGTLKIPWGKMTEYIHHGYASKYEKYLMIEIKQGKVINRIIIEE